MIQLLGVPQQVVDGKVVTLPLRRSYWLLYYLACHPKWVHRGELITFLRPELRREGGSLYLRQLLTEVRKVPWASTLEVEKDHLRWRVDTDVEHFRAAISAGRWHEALKLYRGPLLSGLDASYLPTYESWLEAERASLAQAWRDTALHHIADLEASSHEREAASLAKQLYDADNLDEEALHNYLRNAYLSGQRHQALKVADAFAKTLREDFDLEPTSATISLVEAIMLGRPLDQRPMTRRYGRRRSDRLKVGLDKAENVQALLEILKTPDLRLLAVNPGNGRQATLLLTAQAEDVGVALIAITAFAEDLINRNHKRRAVELLMQVWNHPSASPELRGHVAAIGGELGVQFPSL